MSAVREPVTTGPGERPLRKNRDFLLLWTGVGVSLLGTRVSAIAYPLLVLWSGGSASEAGLVGFAAQLPSLLVQLPAGVVVDRWDRRRLMIACNIGSAVALGSVAIAVTAGRLWLPHLMIAAFVECSLTIFYRLAERAAVRNIVPPGQLSAALSQNEARARGAILLGQPLGGLLFALAKWMPLVFTVFSHLFSLVGLLLIRRRLQTTVTRRRQGLGPAVKEGCLWVWRQPFLRAVMGIVAGSNLIFQGLGLALLVIVHEQGGSTAMISLIVALRGVGGLLGALTAGFWMSRLSMRAIVMMGNVAWALLLPLVAFVREPLLLGVIFAGISCIGGTFNVVGSVYQVRTTPDAMQGRVNSVMDLLASGATSLGVLLGGFMLDSVGSTRTVLLLGAAMATVAVAAIASPSVRGLGGGRVDQITLDTRATESEPDRART